MKQGRFRLDSTGLTNALTPSLQRPQSCLSSFVWTKSPEQILAKAIKQQGTSETLH